MNLPARIVSILIAGFYVVFAAKFVGPRGVMAMLFFLTLPLLCIWMPQLVAEMLLFASKDKSTKQIEKKNRIAFIAGWLILAVPSLVVLVLYVAKR